jgi:alpha-amylase
MAPFKNHMPFPAKGNSGMKVYAVTRGEIFAIMNTGKNNGRQLVLCFQVHQPVRLKRSIASEEATATFFDERMDQEIMERVAKSCYLPTNKLLLKLIEQYPQLKITFSISGLALEQMEKYSPEVVESFRALAATGCVDFLSETYYHSLAFLMDSEEFEVQILEHAEKVSELFGLHPWVFRNTSLFYNDEIGRRISMMGFQGVLTEGTDRALKNNPPHCLYEHRDQNGLKILTRNPNLSNDIAFHVANPEWDLTAEKYMTWLEQMPENQRLVVVGVDYETFGEHHKPESGITHFLEHLLLLLAMQNTYKMVTPSDLVQSLEAARPLSIPDYVALAGCDLSTWVGNEKQREAFSAMISLEPSLKEKNDPVLLKMWRCLQSSDHFYYMSDEAWNYSPYASPQEAFDQYMFIIARLTDLIHGGPHAETNPEKINEALESERRTLKEPVWALAIDPTHHGYTH